MTTVYHKEFGQGSFLNKEGMFSLINFNGVEKKLINGSFSFEPIEFKKETKKVLKNKVVKTFNVLSNVEKITSDILYVNHYNYTKTTSISFLNDLYRMKDFLENKGIDGIEFDIVKSIIKYKKASDKQAFVLAKKLNELGF